MNPGPEIKIYPTKTDRIIERFSILLFLFLWVFTIFSYVQLPAIIPIHFDAFGRPDNYGSKWTLFILPTIASIIFAGINYLNKSPQIFNYTVQITEENAESQYSSAIRMLRVLKGSIMLVFSIIVMYSYWTAKGKTETYKWWFLLLILGIIFVPLIYLSIKSHAVNKKSSTS